MVDELLYADETRARTSFVITAENVLAINGVFQEGGLLENMAQTSAAHAGYSAYLENKPVKSGFIGAVKDLNIVSLPSVGEVLITDVVIENQIFNVTLVSAKVRCADTIIASCEMKIFLEEDNLDVG